MTDEELRETIQWVPMSSFLYWSFNIQQVTIGVDTVQFPVSVEHAILSSAQPYTLLPSADYAQLMQALTGDKQCASLDGLV